MISVLILTKDEEQDLPGALVSVVWSDDIHVVDSFSTDHTVAIAEAAGAKVHQRAFDDYATQRNYGLQLPYKYAWLFILDADERSTASLSAEMHHRVREDLMTSSQLVSAFRVRRRDFLFHTHLKHAQLSPYYIRLVRLGCIRYTRAINEVLEVDGPIFELLEPLDHFPFSRGMAHWISRHNRYSTLESQLIHSREGLTNPSLRAALTHPDFHVRRQHQKAIFYKLPYRPLFKLLYMLIVRGALLDGHAGITYAVLQSIYEYMIVLKTRELVCDSNDR